MIEIQRLETQFFKKRNTKDLFYSSIYHQRPNVKLAKAICLALENFFKADGHKILFFIIREKIKIKTMPSTLKDLSFKKLSPNMRLEWSGLLFINLTKINLNLSDGIYDSQLEQCNMIEYKSKKYHCFGVLNFQVRFYARITSPGIDRGR